MKEFVLKIDKQLKDDKIKITEITNIKNNKKETELDVIKKKKVKYLPEYSVTPKVIQIYIIKIKNIAPI